MLAVNRTGAAWILAPLTAVKTRDLQHLTILLVVLLASSRTVVLHASAPAGAPYTGHLTAIASLLIRLVMLLSPPMITMPLPSVP
jgi:hypothetical protein